ncbi:hypothetical protein [Nocardia otitidiscaviarum]|uniref:hypothetical protein n=1 Tax=Nocardia otitidiscaviarum TaxID=1823 RepID=UPI001893A106|nr:hypothetical protein [Nocardia otitidiscaviarum]MBF6178431.1 hypothetical protein [Nocardia otitidiscaviarum]
MDLVIAVERMSGRTATTVTATILTVAIAATGCGDSTTGPPDPTPAAVSPCTDIPNAEGEYKPPQQVCNATMVWSAEPGIDLYSPEATLLRATTEADIIAAGAGLEYSYRGYAAALSDPTRIKHYEDGGVPRTIYGTLLTHIQQIQPTADGFHAEYCSLNNEAAFTAPGAPELGTPYNRGGYGRVDFVRAGAAPETPPTATPYAPAPDRLHWQAPTYNVFDGWTISFEYGEDQEAAARCDAWALSLYPDAPAAPGDSTVLDTPPTPQPAYPGWPAPAV